MVLLSVWLCACIRVLAGACLCVRVTDLRHQQPSHRHQQLSHGPAQHHAGAHNPVVGPIAPWKGPDSPCGRWRGPGGWAWAGSRTRPCSWSSWRSRRRCSPSDGFPEDIKKACVCVCTGGDLWKKQKTLLFMKIRSRISELTNFTHQVAERNIITPTACLELYSCRNRGFDQDQQNKTYYNWIPLPIPRIVPLG